MVYTKGRQFYKFKPIENNLSCTPLIKNQTMFFSIPKRKNNKGKFTVVASASMLLQVQTSDKSELQILTQHDSQKENNFF